MRPDLHRDVTQRLEAEFGFASQGGWLRKGRCPQCRKRKVYTHADKPWLLKCGRLDRCGWEVHVKDHYPELFDNWSNRFPTTDASPTAAADAYRREIDQLQDALADHEAAKLEAVPRLRALIDRVVLTPTAGDTLKIDVIGRMDQVLNLATGKPQVPIEARTERRARVR